MWLDGPYDPVLGTRCPAVAAGLGEVMSACGALQKRHRPRPDNGCPLRYRSGRGFGFPR
jgi:hypothetical protein